MNWNILTMLICVYLIANTGLKALGKGEQTQLIPFLVIYVILSIYLVFFYFVSKSLFQYTIPECTSDPNQNYVQYGQQNEQLKKLPKKQKIKKRESQYEEQNKEMESLKNSDQQFSSQNEDSSMEDSFRKFNLDRSFNEDNQFNQQQFNMNQIVKQILLNFTEEIDNFKKNKPNCLIAQYFKQQKVKNPKVHQNIQGAFIIGPKFDKKISGTLIMRYPNDTIYIGQMQNNLRDGQGVRTYQNQDIVYDGEYQKNKKHGKGTIFRLQDEFKIYEGNWANDEKNGKGILIGKDAIYRGNFFKDEMHGQGEMEWDNGDVYQGDFVNGKKEGRGIMRYANGDYYEGEFRENLMQGEGFYKWASGESYTGFFKEGRMIGHGRLDFNNQVSAMGEFGENDENIIFEMREINDRYE